MISAMDDMPTAEAYIEHLNNLKKDLESRFDDVLSLEICVVD